MFQFEFSTIIHYFDGEGAWITVFDIDPDDIKIIEDWHAHFKRQIGEF
jgi:hypothetical protein